MKEIKSKEMKELLQNKIVKNTNKGLVNQNGDIVGFYRTRNKRYIEDKYADIAKKLVS